MTEKASLLGFHWDRICSVIGVKLCDLFIKRIFTLRYCASCYTKTLGDCETEEVGYSTGGQIFFSLAR